ncbi:hypothetical protein HDF17_002208 [Granulicella arctica]|uniref:Transmembrane protein n=1 Tax=Granulicella arctica TaxID=940613 RepID=A0A7Y9TTE5_9BACT|nr:hypothetical protein [Granulicella arctica]
MKETNMTEANSSQSPDLFTRKWLLVVILCMVPAFALFAYFGDSGRGRAAAGSTIVIMYAARGCWDLRRHTWFWVTLTILIALHVLLVLLVPWTSKSYPGLILFPIAAVDYAIVYGCIKLVDRMMNRA